MNNQQNNKGCLVICLIIIAVGLIGSVIGKSSDYTAEDLEDAKIKQATGQKITKEDEDMLEGYYEWKEDQNKYADDEDN